ncbi:spermidine synthase [Janibacter sp. G56]|uniref:spermidine synthase n=1 Tax=Janibacter sp. G56 TaxID=3418717 RepID=UPI003D06E505
MSEPTDHAAQTIVSTTTDHGDITLRERRTPGGVVHELVVNGVFAMDTVDTTTEVALAERALALVESPRRVLVGGLGLGFTAWNVLKDRRVERVDVVEREEALVEWSRLALAPTLGLVGRHPRAHLHVADVRDVLTGDASAATPGDVVGPWDVILLDVDNGPSFLVHDDNGGLYGADALRATLAKVVPGGVLAIWAAQPEPDLAARLAELAPTQEILVEVHRGGRDLTYALYVARAATAAS